MTKLQKELDKGGWKSTSSLSLVENKKDFIITGLFANGYKMELLYLEDEKVLQVKEEKRRKHIDNYALVGIKLEER